ncbi:MAG: hypothetical protein LBO66_04315 [Deltaproteobacteria bacterium]|jgi:hypothetical protein|nr:hypothetical protein [Deltaproteobacteria bacterium]
MNEIKRRKASAKPERLAFPGAVASEGDPPLIPKTRDYRKVDTPFGAVCYKRPDMSTDYHRPNSKFSKRPKPGSPPWSRPKGAATRDRFPKSQSQIPALTAAVDRELPLAVERITEAEKVLSSSAGSVIDLAEKLQCDLTAFMGEFEGEGGAEIKGKETLAAFASGLNMGITKLFESASFHDSCGQRLIKVRETLISMAELLRQIKENALEESAAAQEALERARAMRQGPRGGYYNRGYDERPRRDYDERPRRDYDERPRRDYDERPPRDYDERPPRSEKDDGAGEPGDAERDAPRGEGFAEPAEDFRETASPAEFAESLGETASPGESAENLGETASPDESAESPRDAGPRGGFQDKPRGGYQDRPHGGYQGRPRGGYQERPQGGYQDRPRGGFQDRPRGGYQDRPRGGYQDRPQGGYKKDGPGHWGKGQEAPRWGDKGQDAPAKRGYPKTPWPPDGEGKPSAPKGAKGLGAKPYERESDSGQLRGPTDKGLSQAQIEALVAQMTDEKE